MARRRYVKEEGRGRYVKYATDGERQLDNLRTIVVYSSLGIGAATGLTLIVRHFIKAMEANHAKRHSLDEGDPATYATQLKMAFDNDMWLGMGTNTEQVFKVFQEIPSKKMYSRVQAQYQKMYTRSLNADLEDELSTDEYNAVIRILNSKK
jgi:hypothetical protein